MIIVRLMGGLGNQLFQIAAGLVLARKNEDDIKYVFLDDYKLANRKFALSYLEVELRPLTNQERKTYLPKRRLRRLINEFLGLSFRRVEYQEKAHFLYDPDFLNLTGNIYLSGFWQSYKYFIGYEDFIKDSFSFKFKPIGKNLAVLKEIIDCPNSVSLHIRRGDYMKQDSGFHVLPNEYYFKALSHLEREYNHLSLFIFSDDIDWVVKNFKTIHKVQYIAHNSSLEAHEDLRLMSACKHNIIANSSLSWWAAFLNTNDNKMVFSPGKWSQTHHVREMELIPNHWIIVDYD